MTVQSALRVGGLALGLVVVFAAAYAVGQAADPQTTVDDDGSEHATTGRGTMSGPHDAHGGGQAKQAVVPAGLQVSADGYTLVPVSVPSRAGEEQRLALRILGPGGAAVTEFETAHEKELHLIVVRRDLSGFQHVHPTMSPDGTWSLPFTFPGAGSYRMFADFVPAGADDGLTLGSDVNVAGDFRPVRLPASSGAAEVGGYDVALEGELVAGTSSMLTLTVSKAGKLVTDLEPYLAAYGHLVALRDGDLAYLHVHPEGAPGDRRTDPGPEVAFSAEVPSTGDYRLFFDFRHGDVVRTAEFTATASTTADSAAEAGHGHESEEG
jgi:hypothetical protein